MLAKGLLRQTQEFQRQNRKIYYTDENWTNVGLKQLKDMKRKQLKKFLDRDE